LIGQYYLLLLLLYYNFTLLSLQVVCAKKGGLTYGITSESLWVKGESKVENQLGKQNLIDLKASYNFYSNLWKKARRRET
jgi:hypothetical protein